LETTKCRTRNRSDIDGEYVASIIGFWILFRNGKQVATDWENKRRPSGSSKAEMAKPK
jgi:hypothetical protein